MRHLSIYVASERNRYARALWCGAVGVAALAGGAVAQDRGSNTVGFEAPTYTGSAAGTPISGQNGWYLPGVAGSIDGLVMTYVGNAFGLPPGPSGGDQFLGTRSNGGTAFARAERVGVAFPDVVEIRYDAVASFNGTAPSVQNLGSFSLQLVPDPLNPAIKTYIQLNQWVDPTTPTAWNAGYLPYTAAGVQFPQPPAFPGPAWQNLQLNRWYRFRTTVDFTQNRITSVSITDLRSCTTTTVAPVDWFVGGGQNSVLPMPTGVRFFAGGGAGNIMGWDNLNVGAPVPLCACDWNCDSVLNSQDFFDFLSSFFGGQADFNRDLVTNSQDFFDYLTCFFAGCG